MQTETEVRKEAVRIEEDQAMNNVLFEVTVGDAQRLAVSSIGRPLTEAEMVKVKQYLGISLSRSSLALSVAVREAMRKEIYLCNTEMCCQCGQDVSLGSGHSVNREPDFNEPEDRQAMGRPFPYGDYVCASCDAEGD